MKQFQKVGVAAAVATVAAGAVAQRQQFLVQRLVTWQSSLTTQYWMALTLVCTSSTPPINSGGQGTSTSRNRFQRRTRLQPGYVAPR